MSDTIYALATAQGKAGVAIVRVSGPLAVSGLCAFVGDMTLPVRAVRAFCVDGDLVDQAFILGFAHGASFTGEATVELHLHGSPAIVAAVLQALSTVPGFRAAQAGEFTRRALENGQLDLAQVEGLADLIDAETEAQRKQAVRVFSGSLGGLVEAWRVRLIRAVGLIEATIDFADEEVPIDVSPEVKVLIRGVMSEMEAEARGAVAAERIRSGFEVAIVGAPNVGKSTLLNRLAGRDAAITSEIAGTTRDVIEVRMDIAGLPVTLLDTAGLREAVDAIEEIGIERGRKRAHQADLRIWLYDGSEEIVPSQDDLVVRAKADQGAVGELAVSGLTGAGVDQLVEEIGLRLCEKSAMAGLAIRERHRLALLRGIESLKTVEAGLSKTGQMVDLLAEDLRYALRCVDSLIGRVDVEDVLGEIFASFCIGK